MEVVAPVIEDVYPLSPPQLAVFNEVQENPGRIPNHQLVHHVKRMEAGIFEMPGSDWSITILSFALRYSGKGSSARSKSCRGMSSFHWSNRIGATCRSRIIGNLWKSFLKTTDCEVLHWITLHS